MIFWRKDPAKSNTRARITPDPERAAELERRLNALTYHPRDGFHRDQQQHRQSRPLLRNGR